MGNRSEGVEVVGEDCPTFPYPSAFGAAEPGSPSAVVPLEMRDTTLAAYSEAGQAPSSAARTGVGCAHNEGASAGALQRPFCGLSGESRVEDRLLGSDADSLELGDGFGQQRVLGSRACCFSR